MARRKGFIAAMAQYSREQERQRQAAARAQVQAMRARDRAERAAIRSARADEREARRLHQEARADEAEALNAELEARREALDNILAATLDVDDHIDLDALKRQPAIPPFDPGPLGKPLPAPDAAGYAPPQLSMAQKLVPGAKNRYERMVAEGQQRLEADTATWRQREAQREQQLAAARADYDEQVRLEDAKVAAEHAEIDAIKVELERHTPESVVSYFEMVLGGSSWPDGFPQTFLLAYDPASRLLGVDYMLPDISVVPEEKGYKYTKARDTIDATTESATRRRAMYSSLIAQSALRILHEIFEADRRGHVETVALNCMVDTIDRATGARVTPCLVSVRATAQVFNAINLRAIDPAACLKGLAASMSPNPAELAPVRPVLELRMVDPRFVTEADVLSELDQRPNLMELTPGEFESLITNLFTRMGLEARMTQASRDGGVDCVAYDPRPIFGGKVVIQAKRYKNTVGVSAVRDLFGTMQNEGASKGILVTTSGYGKAAFEFAEGKPIELLSGANLLYLLAEHAEIEARIVVPETWRDPVADSDAVVG